MKITGIYQIQSKVKPERVYIGSGVSIMNRWSTHLWRINNNSHHSHKLQHHVNKYSVEDLVFSVVEQFEFISKEHLLLREQYYLDTLNPYFNECKIAGSSLGTKFSSDTIRKMSGKKQSEETRIKRSVSMIGKNIGNIMSKEARKKMSKAKKGKDPWNKGIKTGKPAWNSGKVGVQVAWNKGKKATSEAILHQSESHRGVSQSQETIKKRTEGQKIPILQYDLNMVFIREWDSTIGASKNLLINQNSIRKVLNGIRLSVGGFIWRRKNNNIQ